MNPSGPSSSAAIAGSSSSSSKALRNCIFATTAAAGISGAVYFAWKHVFCSRSDTPSQERERAKSAEAKRTVPAEDSSKEVRAVPTASPVAHRPSPPEGLELPSIEESVTGLGQCEWKSVSSDSALASAEVSPSATRSVSDASQPPEPTVVPYVVIKSSTGFERRTVEESDKAEKRADEEKPVGKVTVRGFGGPVESSVQEPTGPDRPEPAIGIDVVAPMGQAASGEAEVFHYAQPATFAAKHSPSLDSSALYQKLESQADDESWRITVNPAAEAESLFRAKKISPGTPPPSPSSGLRSTPASQQSPVAAKYDVRTGPQVPPAEPVNSSPSSSSGGVIKVRLIDKLKGFSVHDYEEGLQRLLDELYAQARVLTPREARAFTILLQRKEESMLLKTLTAISNLSAFTVNQDLLREAGALDELILLVQDEDALCHLSTRSSSPPSPSTTPTTSSMTSSSSSAIASTSVHIMLLQCIANLAVNVHNQKILQASCLQPLIRRLSTIDGDSSELLKLTTMRALLNLTLVVDDNQIEKLVQIVPYVYDRVWRSHGPSCMTSLKLLVNLSCLPGAVPYLLASKAPESLLSLYDSSCQDEVLLRSLAVVINLAAYVDTLGVTEEFLSSYSCYSPDGASVFAVLFGSAAALNVLCEKLKVLKRRHQSEIEDKAGRALKHVENIQEAM